MISFLLPFWIFWAVVAYGSYWHGRWSARQELKLFLKHGYTMQEAGELFRDDPRGYFEQLRRFRAMERATVQE